ncbi:carbon monoxide dehydrogenase subunit G [Arthrobacter ginsengisoli]|uniref:Carbon monoxide dehydrogenase subunit G n=1 Tax=Arthrobacter ginsengisoli TaxID=1356565 RepID=A0ABU1UCF0_9MICC|nr:SRPBCC family protein [Arthrobacter ginsengisoli]MDR7082823.1 carbon monoxide dehydrogenase subunit G [Arthrobacter ginsengisoli]
MQIDSTFSVVAPIDTVWETLMDFERVAGCVPGAQILNKLSDDAYQVGMTVKLGPVNMQYKGLLNVVERNAAEHRAVLGGKAQEARGQGTADATVTLLLTEAAGGTTHGTVNAELSLSGKAAAMGKGVIGSVTEQMMALFADNLQAMVTAAGAPGTAAAVGVPQPEPAPVPRLDADAEAEAAAAKVSAATAPAPSSELPGLPPDAVPAAAASARAAVRGSAAGPSAAGPSAATAASPATAPAGSLDALSLAKGIAAGQLSSPAKVLALMAVVACVSYWAGRLSAFRTVRAIGRLKFNRA